MGWPLVGVAGVAMGRTLVGVVSAGLMLEAVTMWGSIMIASFDVITGAPRELTAPSESTLTIVGVEALFS